MAQMTERELLSILSNAQQDAAIYNGEFMALNEKFYKGYMGEPYGDEVEGQSSVVSTDIADVVEADMPSLARIFMGSGDIVKFVAQTDNPTEIAEAEEKTKYVNWVVRNQPESFKVQHDWLKDAEIQKNGVVKYFVDDCSEVEEVEYNGVNSEELAGITESLQGAEVDKVKVEIAEQTENEFEQTFDIKFRVTRNSQKIRVINIPPESFLISKNASCLEDAELVGDRVRKTRGELLSEGFSRDLINQLPSIGENEERNNSNIRSIRFQDVGGTTEDDDVSGWASESVEISDLYVKVDFDGDGIAERRHVLFSGNHVLVNENFNHVPYASLSAILMPHKAIGRSRAEIVYETQRKKTALERGMLNNIYMVNNPRNVVHPDVDLDDMLNVRINGIVRMEDDTQVLPQNAVFPLVVPYIGDKTLQVMQYVDQSRAQSTGALLANQGLDADTIAKETATRFSGVEKAGQAKIELIARNYAETGYRKLFEGIAWLASRYQNTKTEIRVLGKQLTVNPAGWKYNHHVETSVGLGAGNNESLIESLQGIYAIQQQEMQLGSPLVDNKDKYNTLKRIIDGLGMPNVNEFFNDPEEPEELLLRQNELLNQAVLQLQEQVAQLQNPLAEAEAIKREGDVAIAQGKLALDAAKLEEDKRQFNIETAQGSKQHNEDLAARITELELKYNQSIEQ
jgi:hypothetical protein